MDAIKAVCECKDMAEANAVLAIKRGRFAFIEEWGFFIWIMVVIGVMTTGGLWIGGIIGHHYDDLFHPKYHCNQCDAVVPKEQFRT